MLFNTTLNGKRPSHLTSSKICSLSKTNLKTCPAVPWIISRHLSHNFLWCTSFCGISWLGCSGGEITVKQRWYCQFSVVFVAATFIASFCKLRRLERLSLSIYMKTYMKAYIWKHDLCTYVYILYLCVAFTLLYQPCFHLALLRKDSQTIPDYHIFSCQKWETSEFDDYYALTTIDRRTTDRARICER